ncbi:hypothetical protein B0H14DRAFT_2713390 [Mycena olivaceomarginata]|nr:hypothetical protein B0H14DRAFT_2713390 [Mycena olivaceomarginata]
MFVPFFSPGAALIFPFMAARAFAASTNITVDDTNSTVWTFVGKWSAVTPSTPCPGCFAQPDPKQVFNQSWHDGSIVSGSVTFQGSAIYIYGIDMTATSGTNISFSMNNPSTAGFHYFGGTGTTYNVSFFSATNLDSSVAHTVSFIGQTSLTGAGAMLFDYAVITVDQPDGTSSGASSTPPVSTSSTSPSPSLTPLPPPKPKSKTGPIVGGVVAAVALLAILGAVFLFLRRRRRRAEFLGQPKIDIDPVNPYAEAPQGRFPPNDFTVEPYQPVHVIEPRATSFIGAAVSSHAPASSSPPPPTSTTSTSRSEFKTAPVVLAWDPDTARARELDMEERLRRLESLARPPQYNS